MIRLVTLVAFVGLGMGNAWAKSPPPPPKADCSKFKKMSDGRWTSTVESKVGNPKSFVTLQPGVPIARDLVVVGINISDTIDGICGK